MIDKYHKRSEKEKSQKPDKDGDIIPPDLYNNPELFEQSFRTNPDALAITRLKDGVFVRVNAGFTRLTGFTEKDVKGKSSTDVGVWSAAVERNRLVEELLKGGRVNYFISKFRLKNGIVESGLMSASLFSIEGEKYIFTITRNIAEWMKTSEALKRTEQRFEKFFNNAPVGLYRTTPGGVFLEVNPELVKLLGFDDAEELKRKKVADFYVHQSKRKDQQYQLDKIGTLKDAEIELKRKDGSTFWAIDNTNAIYDENGRVIAYDGSLRDISRSKKDKEIIENERERFKVLTKHLQSGVYTFGKDGVLNYVNSAMTRITGYSEGELLNMHFYDLVHPDHRAIVKERGSRRAQGDDPISNYEFKIVTKNNESKWVEISNGRVEFGGETVVLGTAVDIHNRKNAEKALLESELKFRQISNAIDDIFWIGDLIRDKFLYVSPAIRKITGIVEEEFLKDRNTWSNLIHQDDVDLVDDQFGSLKSKDSINFEYRIVLRSGKTLWLQEKCFGIKNREGKLQRMVGIVRDVTEQKYNRIIQDIILNITNAVLSGSVLTDLLKTIKSELSHVLDSSNFYVALYNEETDTLSLPYIIDEEDKFQEFPARKTVTAHVISKQEPTLLKRPELKQLENEGVIELVGTPAKVWMGAPLYVKGKVSGLMVVQNYKDENAFGLRDLNVFELIAKQVGHLIEKKRVEDELKESEQKFRLLAENFPGVIYICLNDKDYTMTYLNDNILRLTGYNKQKFLKGEVSFDDLIHPEDRDHVHKKVDRGVRQKTPYIIDYRILNKDGKYRWVNEVGIGVYKEDELVHLEGVIMDVTERVLTEKSLAESEERTRALARAAREAIFFSKDKKSIETNTAACEMFGYSYEELIGIHGLEIVAPESRELAGRYMKSSYSKPYEVLGLRKNGERFPMEVHSRKYNYRGEKVWVTVCRDVSRQKEYETLIKKQNEELKIARDKAEESDRIKTAFLANMSHEIRTPLNGILGFAELLAADIDPEERKEYVRIINSSGNQLLNIINDIIDVAKIEAGELAIYESGCNVQELLNELYAFYSKNLHGQRKKLLDVKLKVPNENCFILTDKKRLRQVLTNLIDNALKFTKEGYVEFGYVPKGENLEFFVEDTGMGIDKAMKERIFDRFIQVDGSNTREFGGTGLGLTICKNLLEKMGGGIHLWSEVGKGSRFVFTIPDKKPNAEFGKTVENPSKKKSADWADKTILIVEDDESNFFYLKTIFKRTGIEICWAKNGREAVEQVRNNSKIDIVLMDIQLPILDGYEATERIREIRKNLPVIAQTAYAMVEDEQKCLDAGCNAYISKPIAKNKLLNLIGKYF
ncbi:MAG: PAS domain S-box protein [Bacteroidales bacterium]|nr:PAS domain S-box protein [Bacteroidales bacterium]